MEKEINEVKEALEVEKFKCAYLKEKLKTKVITDQYGNELENRPFKIIHRMKQCSYAN